MIYNLLLPHIHQSHIANVLHYISFRSILAAILSLLLSLFFGPCIIKRLKKFSQPIRTLGPETHKTKKGTPTMGGIMIIMFVSISTLLFANLKNLYIWIILFVFISCGLLGLLDDIMKIKYKNHYGIRGKLKLIFQCIISIVAYYLIKSKIDIDFITFPFFKNLVLHLGYFYVPFVACVIIGTSNAVNLTDGLDGLAIVPVGLAAASFGLIAYFTGNLYYSKYLYLLYIPGVSEIAVFCASLVGGCLGFLWFNVKPAEVFMGDVGSLSLGGALGVISVIVKQEIMLSIIGGLFVIEALSVIIQVSYFKITGGKRIFLMAPIHHHFEKLGWSETKVVVRFWVISLIFAIIGLSVLKLR